MNPADATLTLTDTVMWFCVIGAAMVTFVVVVVVLVLVTRR